MLFRCNCSYLFLLLHVYLFLDLGSEAFTGFRRLHKYDLTRNGIGMPRQRYIMDLQTFRNKVQGTIWRPLYFGSTNPEDNIFFNGEFRFSLTTLALTTAFSGVLPNGTCVDETTFGGFEAAVISNKAEFLSDSYYTAYVSSDPDSYLISIQCTSNQRMKKCPLEESLINFFVKKPRPDSLPLHLAVKDLYRATCLTFDATPGNFRSIFVFGENPCPSP